MEPYRRGYSFEDFVADSLAGLVIIALIVIAAVVVTLVVIALTEVAAVYKRRAVATSDSAKRLWLALVLFLGAVVIGVGLMTSPDTFVAGLMVVSWAFCLFVIFVEIVDWLDGGTELDVAEPELSLTDVLAPWSSTGMPETSTVLPAMSTINGSQPNGSSSW